MHHKKYEYLKMKNRYWLIGGCVALLLSYLLNFVEGKESVYREVNEMFQKESVHWIDSILKINNQPAYSNYNRQKYINKKVHRLITADDTIFISCKFFHPEDHSIFSRKIAETAGIIGGAGRSGYDLTLVDSLFYRSLISVGIEAEVAVELYTRSLLEMFPTKDTMCADAPIRNSYIIKSFDGVPTDTVGIGICNHGKLVGRTRISTSTAFASMAWWGRWQTLIVCILFLMYLTLWGRKKYYYSLKPYIDNIYILGNTCFDFNNRIVVYWNGKCRRMIGNKIQFLKILVESAPAYKLLKEDVCKAMWKRNSKDGQSLYAVMVNDVRGNYLSEDDSLELKTLLKEGVVLHVDETKLKTHPKNHFFMLYLKNRFYLYVEE